MGKLLSYLPRRVFNDTSSTFKVKPWHRIINWGNSNVPPVLGSGNSIGVVNSFASVSCASDKLATFNKLKGVDGITIPEFTTDPAVAKKWLADGVDVVCRAILRGHSGAGITIVSGAEADLPKVPLYVQYVKKKKEFRVHVAFGKVIDVQEKRQRRDVSDDKLDFKVRNHQNGWVYCREDLVEPQGIRDLAVLTVGQLGLDFGAVDIIYNEKQNKVYCLEVNSAPGVEGTTAVNYARAFVENLK